MYWNKLPEVYVSLLMFFFNLISISYQREFDQSVDCLAVQNLLNDSYICLFILGFCYHVCYCRMLSRPPSVFGRCFVVKQFICIGDYIIHIVYMLYVYIYLNVSPIVLIYPSYHLSFWLTITLFYKSVSVFLCENTFIGSNLRITCINDIIGYLSTLLTYLS